MPHTYLVRDYAPKLAARFGKSLISDCIRAQVNGSTITFTRRIFLGKLDADVVSDGAAPVFANFSIRRASDPIRQRREAARRY